MFGKTGMLQVACVLALVGVCLLPGNRALAAEKQDAATNTVVTVKEMCGGCVKRITARLETEKTVAKTQCDIASKTVTITPVQGVDLSPWEIWEIMGGIGKTPTKLSGPSGTYTSKPLK